MWEENTDKRPFVDVLAQLVDHRFSKEWMDEQNRKMEERKKAQQPTMARQESTVEYNLVIKVVSARGIIAKEGKTRNPYCEVNYDGSTFHTEKCENTTEPYWNQHLELKAKDLTDKITLKVWDGKKGKGKIWKKESNDEFLGMVTISIAEIIKMTYQSGYVSQWYQLGKRADKKDKHVGGQILIEATEGKNSDVSIIFECLFFFFYLFIGSYNRNFLFLFLFNKDHEFFMIKIFSFLVFIKIIFIKKKKEKRNEIIIIKKIIKNIFDLTIINKYNIILINYYNVIITNCINIFIT